MKELTQQAYRPWRARYFHFFCVSGNRRTKFTLSFGVEPWIRQTVIV